MEIYVITERMEHREWGEISFDVLGAWPTFDKALESLKEKIRNRFDLNYIDIKGNSKNAYWNHSDWDGNYHFEITKVNYHDLSVKSA